MTVTMLQKAAIGLIALMLVLAISTAPAKRAHSLNLAAKPAVPAQAAEVKTDIKSDVKTAEAPEIKSDVKTVEKPEVKEVKAAEEPRADRGDSQVLSAASRPKVDVHVHINVHKQEGAAELVSAADAEKVRSQIIKEISTTSTKPDTPDNTDVVKAQAQATSAKKVETPDTPDASKQQVLVETKKVTAVKEETAVKQAVPEKAKAGISFVSLLLIPGLVVVALFFANKYRTGELPEFLEENMGAWTASSRKSSLSGSSRSMYGSV